MTTVPWKYALRRGIAADWYQKNSVLDDGEPGYATDTRVFKVGDGTTAWRDLESVSEPVRNQILGMLGEPNGFASLGADGNIPNSELAVPIVVWPTGSEPSVDGVESPTLWVEYTP